MTILLYESFTAPLGPFTLVNWLKASNITTDQSDENCGFAKVDRPLLLFVISGCSFNEANNKPLFLVNVDAPTEVIINEPITVDAFLRNNSGLLLTTKGCDGGYNINSNGTSR